MFLLIRSQRRRVRAWTLDMEEGEEDEAVGVPSTPIMRDGSLVLVTVAAAAAVVTAVAVVAGTAVPVAPFAVDGAVALVDDETVSA